MEPFSYFLSILISFIYPLLLISCILGSIIIGLRYPQARWWDTLLRCGTLVLCFFHLQIALMLGSKGGRQLPPYDLLGEVCIFIGIMAFVYCLPEIILGIIAACRLLLRAIRRLMGKSTTPTAGRSPLGIHPLWLLTPVGVLLLSMKAQAGRHTEMLLRSFSFALWSTLGVWALFHYYPVETKEGCGAWFAAVLYLRAACFGVFLLVPEMVRGKASRLRG